MKKQKTLVCLLLSFVLVLSACQSETTSEESTAYRNHFTEAEKEGGTANFELMKNVIVDARITPAEKYSSGLKKYYLEHYFEAGKDTDNREKFKKNLRLYGKTIPEIQKLIEKEMGGKFVGKSKFENEKYYGKTGDIDLSQSFQKGDDTYEFWANWYFSGSWQSEPKRFNCPHMRIDFPKEDDTELAYTIRTFCRDYKKQSVAFMEDREAQAEKLITFLENLLGRKIADDWDFVPVTAATVEEANKMVVHKYTYTGEEDDYGVFWFYADVDGLPFMNLDLTYDMKEDETASKVAHAGAASDTSKTLMAFSEHEQIVKVSKEGIINLDTCRIRMEGDVYKDTAEVIDPDKVLEQIEKYYNRLLLTSPITVTDIRLAYTGYFTDGSEGEIQPSVAPFWIVKVYVGGEKGTAQFVYDAFTGEAVREGLQSQAF